MFFFTETNNNTLVQIILWQYKSVVSITMGLLLVTYLEHLLTLKKEYNKHFQTLLHQFSFFYSKIDPFVDGFDKLLKLEQ